MTSYFEKLTSINTSSLKLHSLSRDPPPDLTSALDKIEDLKRLKTQLELDLKCEHDEKSDLVSLKVGLETEILELRETNERLEFQVEQLKTEKDKIHHVLAKIKEESDAGKGFIAGGGVMKKYPSSDDLADNNRPLCVTPTSSRHSLERIEEMDENVLESLVIGKSDESSSSTTANQSVTVDQLMKRISFLERENELLRSSYFCHKCKRKSSGPSTSTSVIFEHDDEGLVLSAVDDDDEEDDGLAVVEEDPGFQGESSQANDNVEEQINTIVEMQRKIIERLEREVYKAERVDVRGEVMRMKEIVEMEMERIVRRAVGGEGV